MSSVCSTVEGFVRVFSRIVAAAIGQQIPNLVTFMFLAKLPNFPPVTLQITD